MAHETLNSLIDASCAKYGNRPALGMAFQDPITYEELGRKIFFMTSYLARQGIKAGDNVAILAENSPQWGVAYLAIVRLGAVAVPILPDFLESDVHHIITDSKAKLLFTTGEQIDKIVEIKYSKIKNVVSLDDFCKREFPIHCVTFRQVMEEMERGSARGPVSAVSFGVDVGPDDVASIIYTSGTSGRSKAVMLTHRNLCANVSSANGVISITPRWTFLSILPMSHTYEFTIGFLLALDNGARTVYAGARPTPTVMEKICEREKPTVILVVPLIMEKIYKKRVLPAIEKKSVLRMMSRIPILRRVIFQQAGRRLMKFFGGDLSLVAIGGAAINQEVERFLGEANFPYLVGYGLTEAAPLVSGGPFRDPTIAPGSSGKPVPGVEVKIVDSDPETGIGEIFVRGSNVMKGYRDNPELTAETIDPEGWLASGDLGFLDEKNNLFIKGRRKSVIVLSHGENIYPEAIEDKINAFYHVVESLVVENNDRIEAWVYLDYSVMDDETQGQSQQQKRKSIQAVLDRIKSSVNRQQPSYAQLSRVVERQEPFTKTATHKIKRYLYTR